MKTSIKIYLTIVIVFSFTTYAQNEKKNIIDNKQFSYADVDALKTYERVAEKGYKSIEMFQKLGNAYYFNGELDKAAKWYGELFAMTTHLDSEYYYRYAHSLKSIGNNSIAEPLLEKFNQLSEIDSR